MTSLSDGLEKLEQIVEPIKWRKTSYGMPEADTVAGVYRIVHAMNGGYTVTAKNVILHTDDGRENFATLQDAIDAAEVDYRARIASALNLDSILSEIKRMREIISECGEALGNGAYVSPSASIDFMAKLPGEIRLHLSTLSPQDPTNDRK